MTTDLHTMPTSGSPLGAALLDAELWEAPSWNQPINNPHRTALLASASAKLAETARRIEELRARLETLFPAGTTSLT